jgi:septum formation protein
MIYLASKSPRRQALLRQIGVEFQVVPVSIDERWDGREPARVFVPRLALDKARAARGLLAGDDPPTVLGADTEVVLDDAILGKPADERAAVEMLLQLSGRTHHVYSAVALLSAGGEDVKLSVSRVSFRALSEAECRAYVATGEPLDKAGAYAVQGLAAAFIERLEGSYSGVMGLPLYETAEMLRNSGLALLPPPGTAQGAPPGPNRFRHTP